MSAPLSGLAADVLRALVLGLELRVAADGWTFVGPGQDPLHSMVADTVADELSKYGYVGRDKESKIEITNKGRNALHRYSTAVVANALRWSRSRK